jgi:hypothetical protein
MPSPARKIRDCFAAESSADHSIRYDPETTNATNATVAAVVKVVKDAQ